MGGGFLPSLVFPSSEAEHERTGDDNRVGEYSRKVAWYSGPVMITKGPYQPRDPTAREVDELQAHANQMFFYKGGLDITLNTDPNFYPTEYYPGRYDTYMHEQCALRNDVDRRRSHVATLRGVPPTGNCRSCLHQYPMPVRTNRNTNYFAWQDDDA